MYNVAVTAIIFNDEHKVLITKRSDNKKKFPGRWTVPGGNLEDSDFIGVPTDINNQWYGTLENCLKREVLEEVGLFIKNIQYVCNIAVPGCVIISFTAEHSAGSVILQESECSEYAWVHVTQLKEYDLIEGIEDEIMEAFLG